MIGELQSKIDCIVDGGFGNILVPAGQWIISCRGTKNGEFCMSDEEEKKSARTQEIRLFTVCVQISDSGRPDEFGSCIRAM
jgi:hypothetical protein